MSRILVWVSVLVVGVSVLVAVPVPGDAVVPGANGRIAFDAWDAATDENQIYVMDADGSDQVMLTSDGGNSPAWSPDGSRIAYTAVTPDGFVDIFVMDADGSHDVRLTTNPFGDWQPAWSPDGSKIAFTSYRHGDGIYDDAIYVMNADGSDRVMLANTTAEFEDVFDSCPAWSPDGSKIAFSAYRTDYGSEFYVVDADGSNLTKLPGGFAVGYPCLAWSPDGTQLTYSADATADLGVLVLDVFVMDADGRNRTNITNTPTSEESDPVWSPDGSKIAFESSTGGDRDIFVMNSDGSGRTNLTNSGGTKGRPDWQAVNRPPVAVDDKAGVASGGVVTISVLDNDSDPDGNTVAIRSLGSAPSHGTITEVSGGIRYTHDGSASTTDSFTYLIDDGELTDEATVTITIAVSDPFTDDDDSVFEADIEWMAAEGITKGCNPPVNDRFCPDSVVTRGQMAAFLTRALGLTERLDDPFIDDDDSVFEADIEKLAAAGITKGCNPPVNDRFCPDGKVTREVMAAFLVRALGYTDSGGGDLFIDDDDSIFEADIDRLGTAGVTKGCNPPTNDRYCPKGNVTRGQMAAFLHRALG